MNDPNETPPKRKFGGPQTGSGRKAKLDTPFARWISRSGITRKELCDKLGIRPSSLSQLALGQNEPSLENVLVIEELSKGEITLRTWVKQKRERENKPPQKNHEDK